MNKTERELRKALKDKNLSSPITDKNAYVVGKKRCLIGTVLHNLGVPDKVLAYNNECWVSKENVEGMIQDFPLMNERLFNGRIDLRYIAELKGLDVKLLIKAQDVYDNVYYGGKDPLLQLIAKVAAGE